MTALTTRIWTRPTPARRIDGLMGVDRAGWRSPEASIGARRRAADDAATAIAGPLPTVIRYPGGLIAESGVVARDR